mgnify:CR=1 FL=1
MLTLSKKNEQFRFPWYPHWVAQGDAAQRNAHRNAYRDAQRDGHRDAQRDAQRDGDTQHSMALDGIPWDYKMESLLTPQHAMPYTRYYDDLFGDLKELNFVESALTPYEDSHQRGKDLVERIVRDEELEKGDTGLSPGAYATQRQYVTAPSVSRTRTSQRRVSPTPAYSSASRSHRSPARQASRVT